MNPRRLPLLCAFVCVVSDLLGAAPAATVRFPGYGFEIQALEEKASAAPAIQPLAMSLPARDGFAPNVNVVIQQHAGTFDDYVELTKRQFDQFKFKVLSEERIGQAEWKVEYSGPFQKLTLHWYARAVAQDGKVFLVTATAKDSGWADVAAPLRAAVDSFRATR